MRTFLRAADFWYGFGAITQPPKPAQTASTIQREARAGEGMTDRKKERQEDLSPEEETGLNGVEFTVLRFYQAGPPEIKVLRLTACLRPGVR